MSETQDILDLADSLSAIDKALRNSDTQPPTEKAEVFVLAEAYSKDGSYLGRQSLLEDTPCRLSGLDVNDKGQVTLSVVIDESDPDNIVGTDDPYKWSLDVGALDSAFEKSTASLEFLFKKHTEFRRLEIAVERISTRLSGKRALIEAVRTRLKEGRRAFLEETAEIKELAAADFYSEQENFGIF